MEADEPWPDHITLIVPTEPIPSALAAPLDPGKLNPRDHYTKFPSRADHQKS